MDRNRDDRAVPYGTGPGAWKAALDFMAEKPEPVIDLSTGQGLIIKA